MDTWGIAIFLIFAVLYFVTKRKYPILAFLSGVGMGIIVGAIWAATIINRIIP